ncbi:MAG: hypothetical protein ACTHMG_14845 [Sphingomonas sp.]
MTLRILLACALIAPLAAAPARAASAPFDLAGPGLQVAVTHDGQTLPIARTPNLSAGDRVSVKVDLPHDQGVRYLLVAGFLRGATNPPPKNWFYRAKTWENRGNDLSLTVPKGARQLVLFLVPDDGGDFDAIVNAVRKQPGTFVRASQELNQASLDRARLDTYLADLHRLERQHPEQIAAISPVLSRSLSLKLKADCLNQAPELQAACLTQDRESLLLADSYTSMLAQTLSGTTTDLAFQVSATPNAGFGYYSSYIGVVRDLARLFGLFQSTHLQYIPALARTDDSRVTLLLNAAPSFGKPKSVMVVAMPAIEPPRTPPLRPADTDKGLCAGNRMVMPVEGAPLIYATRYAHNMVLRLNGPKGVTRDVPVDADPERGGYVPTGQAVSLDGFGATIDAQLHGSWGFAPFDGPHFQLQNPQATDWHLVGADPDALVAGRDNDLVLAGAPACLAGLELRAAGGMQPIDWKASGGDRVAFTLPAAALKPGKMTLVIRQQGMDQPQTISLDAFTEAARIDALEFHAGDAGATLTGTRLDEVKAVSVGSLTFTPGAVTRSGSQDQLALTANPPADVPALPVGASETAKVALSDGRTRTVSFTVAPPRPAVSLIGMTAMPAARQNEVAVALSDPHAVPVGAKLTFSFRTGDATTLSGGESVEIATADGRASATVTDSNGYTIQNGHVGVVSIDPGALLGATAFGPLRFRLVDDGVASDWAPLATLVRLPALDAITCDKTQCTVNGTRLFLLAGIAPSADFANAVTVPDGFTGTSLTVPRPSGDHLYLRLRDAPDVVASVAIGH